MAVGSAVFVQGDAAAVVATFALFVLCTGVQGSCTDSPITPTPKALPFVPKALVDPPPKLPNPIPAGATGTAGGGALKGAKDCCLISLMVGFGGVVLKTGLLG